ncbi:MAG: YncE family protein [Terriglobales bacterium]
MRVRGYTLASLLVFLFAAAILPAVAQTLLATVPVEQGAYYLATNPVTNKTYVVNYCGNDPSCANTSPGTVSVINGLTNTVDATITVGVHPTFVMINPLTNKLYVPNRRDGTVSVINGATNVVTATIPVGAHPTYGDINILTNRIYVVNNGNGQGTTMSVIDGHADTVIATVTVGNYPLAASVNPVTNKIYVANYCGNQFGCNQTFANGTVSVVDGASNTVTATVTVAVGPALVFADPATNKVWVLNSCGSTLSCDATGDNTHVIGSVTQIDGATLATSTVNTGQGSGAMAYNPVANKAYVSNSTDNTETFIDGVTLTTTTVGVGLTPADVEVNPVTNKIYVCNSGANTVTTIDGTTLATTTIGVGNTPVESWVNPATNRVYVSNVGDQTVSVLGGVPPNALQFVPVTPCRLVDTRPGQGGNGPIPAGTSEDFPIPQLGGCNIPDTAAAYSLNVSVVPASILGYLTIWPTGERQPLVATLNSLDGRIKADAAIVPAGYQGAVSIYVTNTTNVILDINGYFAPVSGSTLAFYPLTPCRVADTRNSSYPQGLGPPFLTGHTERDFPILNATTCNIPSSAEAYSLNFSVVPHGGLGYLTVWPTGQTRPLVSTLNDVPGTIIANAAIVPAGTGGDISLYPSNDTDVVIDINGYFALAGTGGLSLYPVAPCRVIDTRQLGPPFSGTLTPPVDVVDSPCEPLAAAQAYVFNATVVPTGALGYLTLWPDGATKPLVSTLNALDGSITNNMAIVPSTNGKVDAYASGITQLILDISSYFAP